jgi:hypothetical protein
LGRYFAKRSRASSSVRQQAFFPILVHYITALFAAAGDQGGWTNAASSLLPIAPGDRPKENLGVTGTRYALFFIRLIPYVSP